MELKAFLYGSIVGLSLGFTGGGGAIFAIPLLFYGLQFEFRKAVVLSLGIVGSTAFFGAVLQAFRGHVLWGAGIVLGLGGLLGFPFGKWFGELLSTEVSLISFAMLMIFIGLRILTKNVDSVEVPMPWISCPRNEGGEPHFSYSCASKLLIAGIVAGVLSGIFGVGGGFILTPTLVLVTGISIERAMATSLVAISIIAFFGLLLNFNLLLTIESNMALFFLGGAFVGMILSASTKIYFSSRALEILFALLVLFAAAFVLLENIHKKTLHLTLLKDFTF